MYLQFHLHVELKSVLTHYIPGFVSLSFSSSVICSIKQETQLKNWILDNSFRICKGGEDELAYCAASLAVKLAIFMVISPTIVNCFNSERQASLLLHEYIYRYS